jgi:hypothetical protein
MNHRTLCEISGTFYVFFRGHDFNAVDFKNVTITGNSELMAMAGDGKCTKTSSISDTGATTILKLRAGLNPEL